MLDRSITEAVDPLNRDLDTLRLHDLLVLMNRADYSLPKAVEQELPHIERAVEAIVGALRSGGRLYYVGAGTSGRLGVLDASECPPTFGVSADLVHGIIAGGDAALRRSSEAAEDSEESGAADLQHAGFKSGDILVGIAASGHTPYVLGAIREAKRLGSKTVGISCTSPSPLSDAVDYPIEPKPGPELIAGSTRLRAGTATKLVLNMISTSAMIQLGHVYGNLMVNVQPTNRKLAARARRIIMQVTGVDEAAATTLLNDSGNNVRVAIVMEKKKASRQDAERILHQAKGRLRTALEAS